MSALRWGTRRGLRLAKSVHEMPPERIRESGAQSPSIRPVKRAEREARGIRIRPKQESKFLAFSRPKGAEARSARNSDSIRIASQFFMPGWA
ncbi:hypothetical protein, partial [Streptomyces sp. NPDC048224]|uniref:hypothetical protein n=1 Tax=Streptomyces sp. NPDC048224 TaxID=3154500 RepID=UPI0033C52CE0